MGNEILEKNHKEGVESGRTRKFTFHDWSCLDLSDSASASFNERVPKNVDRELARKFGKNAFVAQDIINFHRQEGYGDDPIPESDLAEMYQGIYCADEKITGVIEEGREFFAEKGIHFEETE